MAHAVLLVQRGNRLGAGDLSSARGHFAVGHIRVHRANDVFDHRATKIALGNNAICLELAIGIDGRPAPAIGRKLAGPISQHIAKAIHTQTGNHNAD